MFKPLLVTSQPNIYYLTGLKIDGIMVCIDEKNYVLTVPLFYWQVRALINEVYPPYMSEETKYKFSQMVEIIYDKTVIGTLKKLKEKIRTNKIYVDTANLYYKTLDLIKKVFPEVELKDEIMKLRMIKTEPEIKMIKGACRIICQIFEEIKSEIKPKNSEINILRKIKMLMHKKNVEPAFEPICAVGVNSSYPHHIPTHKKIKNKDIVLIDMGCKFKNYCSDMTRVFFVGKPVNTLLEIYNLVKKIQKKVLENIKPGITVSKLHEIAIDSTKRFKDNYLHATGHGIGLEVHEGIRLKKNENTILKPGMIFTVEPGIYIEKLGGVRIEDVVLVTENGYEILT